VLNFTELNFQPKAATNRIQWQRNLSFAAGNVNVLTKPAHVTLFCDFEGDVLTVRTVYSNLV